MINRMTQIQITGVVFLFQTDTGLGSMDHHTEIAGPSKACVTKLGDCSQPDTYYSAGISWTTLEKTTIQIGHFIYLLNVSKKGKFPYQPASHLG